MNTFHRWAFTFRIWSALKERRFLAAHLNFRRPFSHLGVASNILSTATETARNFIRRLNRKTQGRRYQMTTSPLVHLGVAERGAEKSNNHSHFLIEVPKTDSSDEKILESVKTLWSRTKIGSTDIKIELFEREESMARGCDGRLLNSRLAAITYVTKQRTKNLSHSYFDHLLTWEFGKTSKAAEKIYHALLKGDFERRLITDSRLLSEFFEKFSEARKQISEERVSIGLPTLFEERTAPSLEDFMVETGASNHSHSLLV